MTDKYTTMLKKYLQFPGRLEVAIAGFDKPKLDLTLGTGWAIPEYVHHTVKGEMMWQIYLGASIGTNGIEIPFHWFFTITQHDWSELWISEK